MERAVPLPAADLTPAAVQQKIIRKFRSVYRFARLRNLVIHQVYNHLNQASTPEGQARLRVLNQLVDQTPAPVARYLRPGDQLTIRLQIYRKYDRFKTFLAAYPPPISGATLSKIVNKERVIITPRVQKLIDFLELTDEITGTTEASKGNALGSGTCPPNTDAG